MARNQEIEVVLKPFATKLDESVLKKLDDLALKTQIPKSRLCRQAIELLADYYEEREKKLASADLRSLDPVSK